MGDLFDQGAWRGVRKVRFIVLPTFPSQLSSRLGDFRCFLTRQHIPKRARFLADGQWGVSSPVSLLFRRNVGFCGC